MERVLVNIPSNPIFERVVRAIPRIQIRTLDSFFAGIVTAAEFHMKGCRPVQVCATQNCDQATA